MGKIGFTKRKKRYRGGRTSGAVPQIMTQMRAPPERSVYVIGCAGHPVKVGIAADVSSRLTSIQVGFPYELRVYFSAEVVNGRAREAERMCHQKLAEYRTRGEWFNIDPYEAVETVRSIVASF